jgi:hypothetical protein
MTSIKVNKDGRIEVEENKKGQLISCPYVRNC